jgi:two-component system cell cycle sensor histidine kinase PleC
MSHELRTPLNAVIGFSELLMARYFGSLNEKQAEYVADIHKSGKHLLDLINGILDLAKVEAGRYELNESAVDTESLFDEAVKFVTVGATAAGVTLVRSRAGKLIWVRADRRALLQVLINLLSNAVKFTGRGGTVTLASSIAADGALTISVTDTGCGIPVTRLATIFEPFQSYNSDQARVSDGTGLGLSISNALVKSHGGTLSIESVVDRGTVSTIHLPANRIIEIDFVAGRDHPTRRSNPTTDLRDAI